MCKALKSGLMTMLLLAVLTAACSRTPDEVQVRNAIKQAAAAAEQGSAGDLGDVLSKDFDGNAGELDRRRLMSILRVQHFRGDKISVLLGPIRLEPHGDRLVAYFTATLGGGGRIIPERLGIYEVEAAWKHENGDWLCYNATWKRKL